MAKKKVAESKEVTVDRRDSDRRGEDRRKESKPVANDRRQGERRKVQRRRQIDPTTCERDYSTDEIEFMTALDEYKRSSGRMFPTCSEILEVVKAIGYRKVPNTDAWDAQHGGPVVHEQPEDEGEAPRVAMTEDGRIDLS